MITLVGLLVLVTVLANFGYDIWCRWKENKTKRVQYEGWITTKPAVVTTKKKKFRIIPSPDKKKYHDYLKSRGEL